MVILLWWAVDNRPGAPGSPHAADALTVSSPADGAPAGSPLATGVLAGLLLAAIVLAGGLPASADALAGSSLSADVLAGSPLAANALADNARAARLKLIRKGDKGATALIIEPSSTATPTEVVH